MDIEALQIARSLEYRMSGLKVVLSPVVLKNNSEYFLFKRWDKDTNIFEVKKCISNQMCIALYVP